MAIRCASRGAGHGRSQGPGGGSAGSGVRGGLTRRGVALIAAAALAVGLAAVVSTVGSAGADTRPAPGTPATVSADALPTVQVNGVVWSQVTVGDVVYATGSFTSARPAGSPAGSDETPRSNLLAYDITTGKLLPIFTHGLNAAGQVIAASPDGTTIYVGGDFTSAGGQAHQRLAAFDAATGNVIEAFAPRVTDVVKAIVATRTAVYLGGNFTAVDGTPRKRLAAVSPAGTLLPWAPAADDGEVTAMIMSPDGSKVIIGGHFSTISSHPAFGLGAVSVAGLPLSWATQDGTYPVRDYGAGAAITSLSTDGKQIYGTGYAFGGGNFEGRFAFSPADGAVIWVDDCHGDTYDSYPMDGVLYSVGHAHDCSAAGGFPETAPRTWHRALAERTSSAGGPKNTNKGPDAYGWNYAGIADTTQLDWYPDLTQGTFTGQGQAAWSITGNGRYVALGGEFPAVNGTPQQGLVRFAVTALAPNKIGPAPSAGLDPVASLVGSSVKLTWTATSDRDNEHLTYQVERDGVQVALLPESSTFWQLPAMSFTDLTVRPGRHTYRITAIDPFGNKGGDLRDATITVLGATAHVPGDTTTPPVPATANAITGIGARCLDGVAAGSLAGIAPCRGAATQRWQVAASGLLQQVGTTSCLYAGGWAAGATPYLAACDPANVLETWRYVPAKKELVSRGAGLCLAAVAGTRLSLAACDGSAPQRWSLPGGAAMPTANGPGAVTAGSGQCLGTVAPASYAEVARCAAAQPQATQQSWVVGSDGLIQQATHDWCLYAGGTATGATPAMGTCDVNIALEVWRYQVATGHLINSGTGLCLAASVTASANGSYTTLAQCASVSSQRWALPGGGSVAPKS
jgi:hypothetical protein